MVKPDTYSAHVICGCENSFIELMMRQLCIDAGREHDFVRCMNTVSFMGKKTEWNKTDLE